MTDFQIDLGRGIILDNPVLTASGTLGYGDGIQDIVDVERFGGIITKSITQYPRSGNPPPRIVETPAGMINSIGLANLGLEAFILEKSPFLANLKTQVIVNVAGSTESEYLAVIERLSPFPWIKGFEINVSCPNVKQGGITFGTDPQILSNLVAQIRPITDKLLIVKLTPNVTKIEDLAQSAVKAGADVLSLVNTFYGAAIDIESQKPCINTVIGGLSGPAIKPAAIANVIRVARQTRVPIIGIGGISNGADVVEFLLAGAVAVQLGTVNFFNPIAIYDILKFLEDYCNRHHINRVFEIIGNAIH
jgi:dihydroorotate dehydrogenase (NAD+) catalytic subunit